MTSSLEMPKKPQLPKLMACMTKTSLENLRNKALFSLDLLDAKGIRRRKLPLHECLILELRESGFTESSDYLQDLIYDNMQLIAEDEIGIVVDIRKREDYLEHICTGLQRAETERDKDNTKKECLELLELAMYYSEKGKGILWLAEKLFLASIAVSSQYLLDGGRQKGCCKYHYANFLLDKFPETDMEEPFLILTEVRDSSIGKKWPLYEPNDKNDEVPTDTIFAASAIQLHRVLLSKARSIRKEDASKAERLSRLAERRAKDGLEKAMNVKSTTGSENNEAIENNRLQEFLADEITKTAEAIIEIGISQLMMNNLNNAQKTFERAFKIYETNNNVEGLCESILHLAAVMQRLGDYQVAARLLTEMGALAMEHGLRRQLGRALHLLGELHLRRERPELGTQHLSEAFSCFMGFDFQKRSEAQILITDEQRFDSKVVFEPIYESRIKEIFEEEAEQSRLMMAISAGQELMASYFNLIKEAVTCSVAQMKVMEWKSLHASWWVKRQHHDLLPCLCPVHNRTPLDVLSTKLELKVNMEKIESDLSEGDALFGRIDTVQDIRKLRSSYYHVNDI